MTADDVKSFDYPDSVSTRSATDCDGAVPQPALWDVKLDSDGADKGETNSHHCGVDGICEQPASSLCTTSMASSAGGQPRQFRRRYAKTSKVFAKDPRADEEDAKASFSVSQRAATQLFSTGASVEDIASLMELPVHVARKLLL